MSTQFALDLRLARRKSGFTQKDVAHLLRTNQSLISDLERGRSRPTLEQIIDLSLVYGRSFDSFYEMLVPERRERLTRRLKRLPEEHRTSVYTHNRSMSLKRLKRRLAEALEYGA